MFVRANNQNTSRSRGFTLIEAAVVTAIVGIGIVAMMQLIASGTMANTQSTELTTAMGLAGNIHERALGLDYENVFSTLDNRNYSPPINAQGTAIADLPNWQQSVDVKYVDPDNLRSYVPDTQEEPVLRVTVTISHGTRPLYTASWLMGESETIE
jgi:prepilin-type N-terminal cleavage/methylation domain-containing protein